MARPKKEKELKREHRVTLRFTDVEYEIITENAKNAKLPLAEYARLQTLGKKVTAKYEIVADVPELKKLIAEFDRIGNNLNQTALQLNQGGSMTQEMAASIHQCTAEIFGMKYKVLKMAGDFSTIRKNADSLRGKVHGITETLSRYTVNGVQYKLPAAAGATMPHFETQLKVLETSSQYL